MDLITTRSYALEQHNKDALCYSPYLCRDTISDEEEEEEEEEQEEEEDNISQDTISEDNSSEYEDENETDVGTQIEAALLKDDKDEFVRLIQSLSPQLNENEIFNAYLDICSDDSLNCFTALFHGELAPILTLKHFLDLKDNIPLHRAARSLSCPQITAFWLRNGYSPNFRVDFTSIDVSLKNALPLNVALETYLAYKWRGGSAIQFFTSFVEASRASYQTISILARNTCEIKHEFFKYLKQGKMVQVGILLAIARDCILSSSASQGKDYIGFKDISEMNKYLSAEIEKLSVDATTAQSQCKTQLLEMNNTLQLLEIFDKIGDKFIALCQTSRNGTSEVQSLINDAGLNVDLLKTNSELRRSVHLHVVDKGLLPSSFDEQDFCDHVAKYGVISPKFQIRGPYSVSLLPSRVTIIIGKTRVPGIVDSDEEV